MYLNKVFIIGNLTRDPEIKALPSGTKVASFGMATNRVWKDKEGKKQEAVEYHNIVAFGRLGELAGQYLKKGSKGYLEGQLQTDSRQKLVSSVSHLLSDLTHFAGLFSDSQYEDEQQLVRDLIMNLSEQPETEFLAQYFDEWERLQTLTGQA